MEMNNDIFTPDLPIPEPVEFEDAPIAVLFQQICRRAAVGHGLAAVTRLRQDAPHQHGNGGFIVHNQNRIHSTIPLYNPYCTTECYISVNF